VEDPSLVLLTEELAPFVGRRVVTATGNATLDFARLRRKTLRSAKSWGKHLLLEFDGAIVRIHFLMFGSYRIDARRDREPRLALTFAKGEVNFYSCAARLLGPDEWAAYDWSVDVMSPAWDAAGARRRVRERADELACDVLMDQAVFAGAGNIIKNEVLFNLRLHPEAPVGRLAPREVTRLVDETRAYAQRFYEWKKRLELKQHWQVFRKRICPACGGPVTMRKTGRLERVSFFCEHCQPPPAPAARPAGRRSAPKAIVQPRL
jgi:endonuclease VIII